VENRSYNIQVNDQSFSIKSDDGEGHVRQMEARLNEVIDALTAAGTRPNLSAQAIKVAITLADDATREKGLREQQERLIDERLSPLLSQLDHLLGISQSTEPEVAISPRPV
jgi:cell division protein ZapA (FtsZ GTPase activity inhibitor)